MRTPTSRSSTTSTAATSPSTTVMPRAANCSACSGVGAGIVWEKKVTSAVHCRNSNAWCTDIGPLASTPTARSRTSHPWQYGQCSTSRPHRSRSPATSGSSSTRPVVTSSRRARTERPSASVTANPSPSRTAAATVPSTTRPPYCRTSDRPRASSSPGGVPSRPSSPCTPSAGALRGAPASITTTDRRARASISAPFNPAAPPPITTTSALSVHSVIATTSTTTMRRIAAIRQSSLPMWQHGYRGRRPRRGHHGSGPAAAGAAPAARHHARRAVGADRHLQEHALAAGVG